MFKKFSFYFLIAIGAFIIISQIAFIIIDNESIVIGLVRASVGLIPIFIALMFKGPNNMP